MTRIKMKLKPVCVFWHAWLPEQHFFGEDNKLPEKEVLTDPKQDPAEESEASTKEDSDK